MKNERFQIMRTTNNNLIPVEELGYSSTVKDQDELEITTKFSRSHFILNISFQIIILIISGLLIFSELYNKSEKPFDIILVGLGILLIFIVTIVAYKLFSNKHYLIKGNVIQGRTMLESEFSLIGEITGFRCQKYVLKHSSGEDLVLKCKNGKDVQLDSSVYKNYQAIRYYCQSTFPDLKKQVFPNVKKKALLKLSIVFIAISPLLFFAYQAEMKIVKYEDLIEIEITLENSPKKMERSNRNGTRTHWLELSVKEYPSFTFRIINHAYSVSDRRISGIPTGQK